MNNGVALDIRSVSKSFGHIRAVDDIDLQVRSGEIHGLLGPNGSGKSTLMKMILGMLKPDSGSIKVFGIDVTRDPVEVRRRVGYVPETPRLYEFLTGIEYLDFVADIFGLEDREKKQRIDEFLKAFELDKQQNDMISGYSQGMKQKTAITAALLHKPKLLILDEPLSGLDPRSARIVKDLIHRLSSDGVATVFSTHILEIAEAVCDIVTIMDHGHILAEGPVTKIRELSGAAGSTLEEIFLQLTGGSNTKAIVDELSR